MRSKLVYVALAGNVELILLKAVYKDFGLLILD